MSPSSRRKTIPNLTAFIILEVVALCLIASHESVQKSWLGQMFTNARAIVWKPVDNLGNYLRLREENIRLANDNYELFRRLDSLTYSATPPAKWVEARHNFTFLPATVITMSHGSQHNYIIIDKGSEDGVGVGDGIMTEKAVVGIIQSVTRHYSSAISYANTSMVTSARPGHEDSVGSMVWSGKNGHTSLLGGIPLHSPAQIGDTVYTSGYSSIFPADIPLGTITDRETGSGYSCEFTVSLFVDYSALRHVMVVRNLDKAEIDTLKQESECKTAKE